MSQKTDKIDPFNAGQMVGMLVMLTYIEENKGISAEVLEELKKVTAEKLEDYFEKPSEDIFLMINNVMEESQIL